MRSQGQVLESADPQCQRCGVAAATAHFSDAISDPPRDLRLCERCLTVEKGAFVLYALREMGDPVARDVEPADEETRVALGKAWDNVFLDAMDSAALADSEADSDPDTLRAVAAKLEYDAARLDRKLSRAQKAFVRRYLDPTI